MKKKKKSGKKEQTQTAVTPSRYISANEIRYATGSASKKTVAQEKKAERQFDKQLAASTRDLMFNLWVMLVIYIFIMAFNLALPLYVSSKMAFHSFFQKGICIVHTYNILSAWGWFKHKMALAWMFLVRILEVVFYVFIRANTIQWPIFAILIVLDILFLIIFTYDTKKYEEVERPVSMERKM